MVAAVAIALALVVGLDRRHLRHLEHLARSLTVVVAAGVAIQVASCATVSELASELEHVMARTLALSPSLEEATQLILERVRGVLGWQAGAFWEVDEREGVLRCVSALARARPRRRGPSWNARGTRSAARGGPASGRGLARAKRGLGARTSAMDPNFPRADSAAAAGPARRRGVPDRQRPEGSRG